METIRIRPTRSTPAPRSPQYDTLLTPAVNDSDSGDERFWADDLVYASSAGKVMSKADIMKSFADKPKAAPGKQPEPAQCSRPKTSSCGRTATRRC
jgi:hypothetical protein